MWDYLSRKRLLGVVEKSSFLLGFLGVDDSMDWDLNAMSGL